LGNFPTLAANFAHTSDISNYRFSFPTGYSTQLRGRENIRGVIAAGDMRSPFGVKHPDGPVGSDEIGERRVSVVHNNGTEYNFNFPLGRGHTLTDVNEKPVSVDFGEQYIHTYAYADDGALTSITDSYGRQATFEYNVTEWSVPNGLEEDTLINGIPHDLLHYLLNGERVARQAERGTLKKITFPDGTYTEYEYDSVSDFNEYWDVKERLIRATKFDPNDIEIHSETYHYEDERMPYALTGITDDADIRFATWSYDKEGRANMSEHAGGVGRIDIVHGELINNGFSPNTREVANALGHTKTYSIDIDVQDYGIRSVAGEGTEHVKSTNESYRYAVGGGVSRKTDALSRQKNISINTRGFPLSKTYAAGTSEEFTATYTWHERFRRPTQTVKTLPLILRLRGHGPIRGSGPI